MILVICPQYSRVILLPNTSRRLTHVFTMNKIYLEKVIKLINTILIVDQI